MVGVGHTKTDYRPMPPAPFNSSPPVLGAAKIQIFHPRNHEAIRRWNGIVAGHPVRRVPVHLAARVPRSFEEESSTSCVDD